MNSSSDKRPCPFNCGQCVSGQPHLCRLCGKYNSHRSANCPSRPCTLNCGMCSGKQPHVCRKCGEYNSHRSKDCPTKAKSLASVPAPIATTSVRTLTASSQSFVPRNIASKAYVSDRMPVTNRMDSSVTNTSINICYFIAGDGKVFIAIHGCNLRKGKFMGAGGGVKRGQSREEAADAENREEHGYNGNARPRYIGTSENSGSTSHYHHYASNVDPRDYSSRCITTPEEIVMNPHHVPAQFGSQNCIRAGDLRDGRMSIHFVELGTLLSQQNKTVVYGPFRSAVIEMSKLGVFI